MGCFVELKGKVVFASGATADYDIWTLDLATQEIKQLTFGSYWNDCPKWSPDGKKIIFVSNRAGTPEIWLMNQDGSNQTRLTNTNRWHNTPDWSPDGKKIVFCANYKGNADVYVMKIDGSGLKRITDYEEMDFNPQFSPDGKKIIFTSQRSGNDDIWEYDCQAKEFRQLTTYNARDFSPAYSPDGGLIAFVCGEATLIGDENLDIYLLDKDGENRRRITRTPGVERFVGWSGDGKYLIYTSSKANSNAERLMVLDIGKMKAGRLEFDRKPLEQEIDAEIKCAGLFCLLPESIIRKTYPETYFGTERYPDWKS